MRDYADSGSPELLDSQWWTRAAGRPKSMQDIHLHDQTILGLIHYVEVLGSESSPQRRYCKGFPRWGSFSDLPILFFSIFLFFSALRFSFLCVFLLFSKLFKGSAEEENPSFSSEVPHFLAKNARIGGSGFLLIFTAGNKEWLRDCRKVCWTKMAQNGQHNHFGPNDLLPNWTLASARPNGPNFREERTWAIAI